MTQGSPWCFHSVLRSHLKLGPVPGSITTSVAEQTALSVSLWLHNIAKDPVPLSVGTV